jgi:predicted TIM-barrel fold metal-dependent hydrolase
MVAIRLNNTAQQLKNNIRVTKVKIIDPHLHLFDLELGHYHWLKAENPPFWPDKPLINKNFDETDLTLTEPLSLAGFIHIEAGFDNEQPWRELATLEQSCNKPFRAIANIDLTASSQHVNTVVEKLAERSSFVGVRHLLDEQGLALLTKTQVLNNFEILNENGLVFEVQLSLIEHAPVNALCDVISDNPDIHFIINHAGFPPADIHTIEWQRWQSNLTKLSGYPHVAIKCSGWEMTNRNYKGTWLNENLSLIFAIFGAKKVMLASNFPL